MTSTRASSDPPDVSRAATSEYVRDPRMPLTTLERDWVEKTLASLSPRQRVAQLIMVWVLGDYVNAREPAFTKLRRLVEQDEVGGVSMSLGSPIEVAEKLNALQSIAAIPLLVGADLEPGLGRLQGGVFPRYSLDAGGGTVFPSAMAVGATGRDQDAYLVARAIAREGRAVGIHVAFSPVVDVLSDAPHPIMGTRSFGDDAELVARLATAYIHGTYDGGMLPTAKHFPGHGSTGVDSHDALPTITRSPEQLDAIDLLPFRAAIAADVPLIMTAHLAVPGIQRRTSTPATIDKDIVHDLLRERLRFRGVVVTDSMSMRAVGREVDERTTCVAAVNAGADVILQPRDPTRVIDALASAVDTGVIAAGRIEAAARSVLELKARAGLADARTASVENVRDIVGAPEHRLLSKDIVRRSLVLIRDRDRLVPLRKSDSVALVAYAPSTEFTPGYALAAGLRMFGVRTAPIGSNGVLRLAPGLIEDGLNRLDHIVQNVDRVILTTHLQRFDQTGEAILDAEFANWVNDRSNLHSMIGVAFGSPYVIGHFPNLGTIVAAPSIDETTEVAVAAALLGRQSLSGCLPISLPGSSRRSEGSHA